MPRACRHLLLALAALIALGGAAPAAGAAPAHGVAVVAGERHHDPAATHCAAGAGSSCQVPALVGGSFVLIPCARQVRRTPPVAAPGAALTRLGPPPPVPVG